jgi:hypothetical protein
MGTNSPEPLTDQSRFEYADSPTLPLDYGSSAVASFPGVLGGAVRTERGDGSVDAFHQEYEVGSEGSRLHAVMVAGVAGCQLGQPVGDPLLGGDCFAVYRMFGRRRRRTLG